MEVWLVAPLHQRQLRRIISFQVDLDTLLDVHLH